MKKALLLIVLCLALALPAAMAEGIFAYRYADADEAATLLLSNREYYEGLNQNDLNYRLQKTDATLAELEAFAAAQTLDYTDAEKAAIDAAMAMIEEMCAKQGYVLPPTEGIVFAKTTMLEECGAGGYTHGTQVYLGEEWFEYAAEEPELFASIVAHELFHCLTHEHPDFRSDMYALLGFTVEDEDYRFAEDIAGRIISNPDVEHHNSHAAFDIGGEIRECAVVFTTKPFEKSGDSFFDERITGLVPVDDLSVMYTSDEAANFWDVFGRNTDYVIDPEETLADNFSFAVIYGLDGMDYPSPGLIEAIDAYLRGEESRAAA